MTVFTYFADDPNASGMHFDDWPVNTFISGVVREMKRRREYENENLSKRIMFGTTNLNTALLDELEAELANWRAAK